MVSKKKIRIQVTMDRQTVELLDKLVEKLNKERPMATHTRSSILEGAFINYFSEIVGAVKNQKEGEIKEWK